MYSEKDRDEIYDYLVHKFNQRKEVLAVIQVGSGAIGYRDKYSDLDFAIVVDETSIGEVFDKTQSDISKKYKVSFCYNMAEGKLQLFLLDNYLELDIGYYTLDSLYARRENYKIVFDKTGKAKTIMEKSRLESKGQNKGTTGIVNMQEVVSYVDNNLWYNVLHSVSAFNRGNKYRAYYELEQIRWYAIDLISKRNNKESKRYGSVIELNERELSEIDRLFAYPKSYDELSEYLNAALDIIFDEFDYWEKEEGINYIGNKDFFLYYVNSNSPYIHGGNV